MHRSPAGRRGIRGTPVADRGEYLRTLCVLDETLAAERLILNQLLALSALSVTLPFISYEYTLVNLIAPFIILVMFLASDVATGRVPLTRIQILALLLPFAVLFAPLTFLLLHGFGFGAQIKSLALLAVIGAASTIRLPSSLFSEVSDRFLMEFRLELIQREAEPSRRRA